MITHYDLFAGIGGNSIALEEVFTDEPIRHIFCEWESFPTAVLKQHWPEGEFWGDIADLVADTASQRQQGQGQYKRPGDTKKNTHEEADTTTGSNTEGLTILTGGFPCQPFSAAGRRKGTADDRYKWPEMFAVIQNVRPEWVIAENVRGLVTWNEGMVLEQVCTDLESEGYEVQPLIIPAVAVNAPHRRDRVWVIATNTRSSRQHGQAVCGKQPRRAETVRTNKTSKVEQARRDSSRQYPDWNRSWQEVAFATCDDSVDDGLPRLVDGVPYSRAKWRKESLKAYGNGIVPQIMMEIFEAIKEARCQQQTT